MRKTNATTDNHLLIMYMNKIQWQNEMNREKPNEKYKCAQCGGVLRG